MQEFVKSMETKKLLYFHNLPIVKWDNLYKT
jgi:hypothetical protein